MFFTNDTPLDQAPRNLPMKDREFWANVYRTGINVYTDISGYYERDARLTADVVTATKRTGCRSLRRVPPPGDLAELGIFTSVDWADDKGEVWADTYPKKDKVLLMWSRRARALYLVPGLKPGACNMPPVFEDHEVLLTWTQGRRGGRCSAKLPPIPGVSLSLCRPGVAVSYTSDKFNPKGEMQDYIHHFDSPGVKVYMDRSTNPKLILIKGGRLRIEEHGIAG